MTWFNTKRMWHVLALLLALVATVAVFLLRIFTVAAQQGAGQTEVRATAFEVGGPSVFLVVAVPLVFTALPLFFRGRLWVIVGYVSAAGMVIYTITGITGIGLLFVPAAIAASVGAFIHHPGTPR